MPRGLALGLRLAFRLDGLRRVLVVGLESKAEISFAARNEVEATFFDDVAGEHDAELVEPGCDIGELQGRSAARFGITVEVDARPGRSALDEQRRVA